MAFSFSGLVSGDVGIDLGTANSLVCVKGKGIVVDEPSIVALDKSTKRLLAVGAEAKEMLGRENADIMTIRPMKDGAISDFEATEEMIRSFMKKALKNRVFVRPKVVIAVPSGITEVERRAVRDSAERAGAREVHLIAEPMSAAIGIGLPVEAPVGYMVIDIGGGTTEIAVIALSGIVNHTSIRIGGDEMDGAILQFLKKKYNLLVGDRTAEQIKCHIGSAGPLEQEIETPIKGRDLVASIPKTIMVDSSEIREALSEPIGNIIDAVRLALEHTPPELSADILDRGIIMSGGGALLKGLDKRLIGETGLPVYVAEDPLRCVVKGTSRVLEDLGTYQKVLF